MTVLFRCRVDPNLLRKAKKVSSGLGTSLEESVRMFMSQMARTRRIPLNLSLDKTDDLVNAKQRNKLWAELDESSAKDW